MNKGSKTAKPGKKLSMKQEEGKRHEKGESAAKEKREESKAGAGE